jgi:hypothetical protein
MSEVLQKAAAPEMYKALKAIKKHFDQGDIIWEPRQLIEGKRIPDFVILLTLMNYAIHLAEKGSYERRSSKPKSDNPNHADEF